MFNYRKPVIKTEKLLSALYLYLILFACIIFIGQIKPASARVITVGPPPAEYREIHMAVDNAVSGDIIQVASGTYYEHVKIWDTLTSLTLIGNPANPATTIVDGMGNGTVFRLDGSNVHITGFTIRHSGSGNSGISSERATVADDNHNITKNIITNNDHGISLGLSNYNTITYNTILDNPFDGIILNSANNNNITGNTITDSYDGITITGSSSNTITNNQLSRNSYSIYIRTTSSGNTVRNNIILARSTGVYSDTVVNTNTYDHNTISECDFGFYFYNSQNAQVYYNTVTDSSRGVRIYGPSGTNANNNVRNNKIANTDKAIEQVYSQRNTFTGNLLQKNTWGLWMSTSTLNTYYHNNFLNNSMQVYTDSSGNTWNNNGNPKEGNRWSDYTGKDNNGDGIGDTTYTIPGTGGNDKDNGPLMDTWSEHDVSVEQITPSTYVANAGAIININVTVKNKGKISPAVSETFTVTAKCNSTVIGTQTVNPPLPQGTSRNLTFSWNTAGVVPGVYQLKAEASIVPDEIITENNIFTDDTITLNNPHNVAVRSVTSSKTIAYAGYGSIDIKVDVKNIGAVSETLDVTAYYNSTAIGTQTVTLVPNENKTLTFTWNIVSVTPSYYNISAKAGPVPSESDLTDNTRAGPMIRLKIPGDIDGSGRVNISDLSQISAHWYPGPPIGPLGYDLNADVNDDRATNMVEVSIVSAHWTFG